MTNPAIKTSTDLEKEAYKEFGVGVVSGNPKRCLHCRQLIKDGQRWTKYVSAEDPEFGRYSFIVHAGCNGATNHK